MKTRIFNTKLTLERHTGGKKDINNRYVDNPPEEIEGYFSVQPYKKGTKQMILPDGIKSEDAYITYGKTYVQPVDHFLGLKADRVKIKNKYYIADQCLDWTFPGSNADHYKTLFVREDTVSQRSV